MEKELWSLSIRTGLLANEYDDSITAMIEQLELLKTTKVGLRDGASWDVSGLKDLELKIKGKIVLACWDEIEQSFKEFYEAIVTEINSNWKM